MKKILALFVAVVLASPGAALALGLGRLELESSLNEPLEARIKLLSATRDELDSLGIALADANAFARAGIDRPFMLSQLRFELREETEGPGYIRVYTREAVREPILNFLVEVNWSSGRLYREYTVLIDPPLYEAGMREVPVAPRAAVAQPAPTAEAPAGEAAIETAVSGMPAVGGDYGPTASSDTLWSIASRMRPDASVSVQQMMLALLRANPEAFINNNINGLKKGEILRTPSAEELNAIPAAEAVTQVKAQHALWEEARGAMAVAATPRPEGAAAPQPATTPAAPAPVTAEKAPAAPKQAKSELKLLAAADGAKGTVPGGVAEADAKTKAAVALADEKAASLEQENVELKDRVTEAETIIEDLKRLIALKDDELAAMQKKLAGDAAAVKQKAAAGPKPAAAPAAPKEEEKEAAAPAAQPPAAETELAAAPPEDKAPPEPAAEEPSPPEDEPAAEQEPTDAGAEPASPSEVPAAGGGMVDQVLQLLSANLLLIGGVLVAVILIVVGGSALQKKRKAQPAAMEPSDLEFPDFSGEKAAALPGAEDETEMGGGMEAPVREPAAKPRAADTKVFAAPARAPAAAAAPAAEEAAPQDDKLTSEVNVCLAYEDWSEAERLVREAIKREPHNLEFHAKLLEVFYAAGDRKNYELAAKVLHGMVLGSGPQWESALGMWQLMSPNRELFAEGGDEDETPAAPAAGGGMLDLTAKDADAGSALDFDIGDATADQSGTGSEPATGDESILDVTAAVGLDIPFEAPAQAGGGEDLLDITGGTSDEGLLDVTAHTNVNEQELDSGGDLLDVTAAAGLSPEADELSAPEPAEEPKADDMSLDFDLNLDAGSEPAPEPESSSAPVSLDNALEFDIGGAGESADAAGAVLDLSAGPGTGEADDLGLGLDSEQPQAEESKKEDALDLSLDFASDDQSSGLEFDMGAGPEESEASPDLEGTVSMPKLSLADEDSDDDDDENHTVFVPRSGGTQQQSAEDEIATKLDLAKAYVELGDKDSAKGILDEIVAEGNAQQKRQAQELMNQLG